MPDNPIVENMEKNGNRAVVLTAVYPGVEKYLETFAESLNAQSSKDFDVLAVSDGADDRVVGKLTGSVHAAVRIVEAEIGMTIAQNRMHLIQSALQFGYKYLIFCDIDDGFSSNRVEETIKTFQKEHVDFLYNPIQVLGTDEMYFSKTMPERVSTTRILENGNFLGLSNTALRISETTQQVIEQEAPEELIAFDWWLYCRMIKAGAEGMLMNSVLTSYRLHASNTAGDLRLTEDKLHAGIKVKKQHYSALRDMTGFEAALASLLKFEMDCGNEAYRSAYIHAVNDMDSGFWWENIDCGLAKARIMNMEVQP